MSAYSELPTLTDQSLAAILTTPSARLMIVLCTAQHCAPCRLVAGQLRELKQQFSSLLNCAKLDIATAPDSVKHYQLHSLPSLLWFKDGQWQSTTVGVWPLPQLIEKVLTLLDLPLHEALPDEH